MGPRLLHTYLLTKVHRLMAVQQEGFSSGEMGYLG